MNNPSEKPFGPHELKNFRAFIEPGNREEMIERTSAPERDDAYLKVHDELSKLRFAVRKLGTLISDLETPPQERVELSSSTPGETPSFRQMYDELPQQLEGITTELDAISSYFRRMFLS